MFKIDFRDRKWPENVLQGGLKEELSPPDLDVKGAFTSLCANQDISATFCPNDMGGSALESPITLFSKQNWKIHPSSIPFDL